MPEVSEQAEADKPVAQPDPQRRSRLLLPICVEIGICRLAIQAELGLRTSHRGELSEAIREERAE